MKKSNLILKALLVILLLIFSVVSFAVVMAEEGDGSEGGGPGGEGDDDGSEAGGPGGESGANDGSEAGGPGEEPAPAEPAPTPAEEPTPAAEPSTEAEGEPGGNGQPANNPPVLDAIGNRVVNENQLLQFSVSGSDPDGDALTFSASNLPNGASFSGQTFSWTPNFLQAGNYFVIFSVSDGEFIVSETVTITVNNINRNPTITSTPITTATEDTIYNYDVNAADPDSDDVLIFLVSGPGGMSINPLTGLISWTPNDAQAVVGTHSVTVQVSDQKGGSAMQTFTIAVTRVNDMPLFSTIPNQFVNEDTGFVNNLVDLHLFASDEEDSDAALTFSIVSQSNTGVISCSMDSNRFVDCTTQPNQTGASDITVRVTDTGGLTATKAFRVAVGSVNDAPTLQIIKPQSTFVEGAVVDVLATSFDIENDPLTFNLNFGDGTIINGNVINNQVVASHIYRKVGIYTLTLAVTDTGGLTDTKTVQVTIIPFSVNIIADKTKGDEPLIVNFDASVNGGNTPLSFEWDFNNDGTIDSKIKNPTAVFRENGKFTVTLTVTDADGDKAKATQVIIVEKAPSSLPRRKIHIDSIRYIEEVKAGEELEVFVSLENTNSLETKELSAMVVIPELGLRKKVGNEQLKEGEAITKRALIEIPEDAKKGIYDVLIEVNDHDTNRRRYRQVRVV